MSNKDFLIENLSNIEEKYSSIQSSLIDIHNDDGRMKSDPDFNENIVSGIYHTKKIRRLLREMIENDEIELLMDEAGCIKLQQDYESTLEELNDILN